MLKLPDPLLEVTNWPFLASALPEGGRSSAASPDAEWAEEYAFVGDNEGRKKLATLARKTTQVNGQTNNGSGSRQSV